MRSLSGWGWFILSTILLVVTVLLIWLEIICGDVRLIVAVLAQQPVQQILDAASLAGAIGLLKEPVSDSQRNLAHRPALRR